MYFTPAADADKTHASGFIGYKPWQQGYRHKDKTPMTWQAYRSRARATFSIQEQASCLFASVIANPTLGESLSHPTHLDLEGLKPQNCGHTLDKAVCWNLGTIRPWSARLPRSLTQNWLTRLPLGMNAQATNSYNRQVVCQNGSVVKHSESAIAFRSSFHDEVRLRQVLRFRLMASGVPA